MWKRKELKQNARQTVKKNYWQAVAVCLVLAFFVGAYPTLQLPQMGEAPPAQIRTGGSNSQIVEDLLDNVNTGKLVYNFIQGSEAPKGVLANLFNSVTSSGSFIFGVLNAVNQFVFGDRVLPGIIMLIAAAVYFVYWLLVGNPLRVGACRFFLESKVYPDTGASRLLYIYRIRRLRNVAKIMFFRTLYITLWSLTIVGGFVKDYAWRLVPYILAENPDISQKQAFKLSAQMMRGNKWKAFVLDVSFAGWSILSFLTFGLLGHFYLNPYQTAADAELYMALRQTVPDAEDILCDRYLAEAPDGGLCTTYPVHLYPVPEAANTAWMSADFMVHYTLTNLILIFIAFCMVGWVWEVIVEFFQHGDFVNRGTLYGPWLPIYGSGGVGVVVLFHRLGKRPLLTFGAVTVFCGVLEYFTSWILETLHGVRWWDYTGYFLNINGRVCLEGLLVFGLGGCAGIYFLAPALNNLFDKIPLKPRRILAFSLIGLFAADVVISMIHPNTAAATDPTTGDPISAAQQSAGKALARVRQGFALPGPGASALTSAGRLPYRL